MIKNIIYNICFKKGYFPDKSFNAWTKYEVDEDEDYYDLEVIFNKQFYKFPEKEMISIIVHEFIHCSFYQMHANGLLNDDEVIALNEMIDNYSTLYFVN